MSTGAAYCQGTGAAFIQGTGAAYGCADQPPPTGDMIVGAAQVERVYSFSGTFSSTILSSYNGSSGGTGLWTGKNPRGFNSDGTNFFHALSDAGAFKMMYVSGQFSSVVRDSLDTASLTPSGVGGVDWDGTDTYRNTTQALVKQSGRFSSTIKDSISLTTRSTGPNGMCRLVTPDWTLASWVSASGGVPSLQEVLSGFSSTILSSANIGQDQTGSYIDNRGAGISGASGDTVIGYYGKTGTADSRCWGTLWSGKFSTTLLDSVDYTLATGFDGLNEFTPDDTGWAMQNDTTSRWAA